MKGSLADMVIDHALGRDREKEMEEDRRRIAPDKRVEADSIKSQEDWNKLCYSAKLQVFGKKFPVAYAEMPKMYVEYREKAIAKSKQFYEQQDWYDYMMQKFVETYLPAKSLLCQVVKPLIIAVKPLIRKC